MRLAVCVAIELAVGAVVAAAVGAATFGLAADVRSGLGRAEAAELPVRIPHLAAELPRVVDVRSDTDDDLAHSSRLAARPGSGSFLGQADEVLLAPLKTGEIESVKFNRGGSSLSLRIDFVGGARAAFKPNQMNLQTTPRMEIAAYRVARLLGIGQVAPAVGRRFRVDDIHTHLQPASGRLWPRFVAQALRHGEWVDGELSFWIPVIRDATIRGHRLDSTDGVVTWRRMLTIGQAIPAEELGRLAQVSDMLLYDFVINNSDRWSGNNTKASEDGQTLYFMDNALAFGHDRRGHTKARTYLERSQKFSRRMVSRLRELVEAELREAVTWDVEPFAFLLDDGDISAFLVRRDLALAYVDRLIAAHGEAAVLVFP